jgi:hypothetical protein
MSILDRLFARRRKSARCAIVVGDGQFGLNVASTAQQRIELERLCDGRAEEEHRFAALLIPQPSHARGRDTVAVRIGTTTVGYLNQTTALELLTALRAGKFDRAACGSTIDIRPDPLLGDIDIRPGPLLGDKAFRIRLDAMVPFKLADPADQAPTSD